MYSVWAGLGGLLIIVWLLILSYLQWRERKFLNKLIPDEGSGNLKDKFEQVLKSLEETERRELILNRNIRSIAKEGLNFIQKVEVIRYNPYGDTGGDQSFSLAVLNGVGTGFILTSLHTRNVTRIYTKNIIEGKCDLKLSKEEEEVIKKALKLD